MDTIGYILEPQGVAAWLWLAVAIGAIVTVLAAGMAAIAVFQGSKNKYDRGWDTFNTFMIIVLVGIGLTGLVSLVVVQTDAQRYTAATVLKIEKELNIDVLSYEDYWYEVGEFTALDSEGGAILGRTSYEGDKIYVLSLTE